MSWLFAEARPALSEKLVSEEVDGEVGTGEQDEQSRIDRIDIAEQVDGKDEGQKEQEPDEVAH